MIQRVQAAALVLMQILLFCMIATVPHPIWTDEVLQFAWGAFPDTWHTIGLIFRSVGEKMNHGQTGAYMILNHLSLKYFGASYFALRFPSYFSYSISLLAGYFFLRDLKVSFAVRVASVVALAFSQLNVVHGWEARPYILLEASVLGFLWAWNRYVSNGKLRWVVFVSALGIIFHPFFVVYAGVIVFLSFLFEERARFLLRHPLKLFLSAFGLFLLLLLIGKLSWFNSMGKKFQLDPYEWVGHDKNLVRFMLGTFFFPVSKYVIPIFGILIICLFQWRKQEEFRPLWRYFWLFAITLAISQTIVTFSVIRAEYWILQRQWVAGSAIAILTATLLVEALVRQLRPRAQFLDWSAFALLALGIVLASNGIIENRRLILVVPMEIQRSSRELLEKANNMESPGMGTLETLANQNLLEGGPVWPIFQKLYLSPGFQ